MQTSGNARSKRLPPLSMTSSSHIESPNGRPAVYTAGTLTYTKAKLAILFLFLLWGDFCFMLMETVVPTILPLKFNSIGISNWAIGLILCTIPYLMTAVINPIVSFRSDRFRSRWGRRIPFLLGATPFVAVFLILLGYSHSIGQWVHASVLGGRFQETAVLAVVMGGIYICFQFFHNFITSVYYYLFNDVVPPEFLTRFMALFRMVGGGAGITYNLCFLKYANSHMHIIFLISGIIYFIGFGIMCLKVKEGDYPPPSPYVGDSHGLFGAIRTYAEECFSHRFYWYIFIANSCVAMTWISNTYALINATKYLGFSLELIGKLGGVCGVIGLLLLYPAGMIADRVHPLRVYLAAVVAQAVMGPLNIAFNFGRPLISLEVATWIWIGLSAINLPIGTLFGASELPTLMKIFPMARYGQFCSAMTLVRAFAVIAGGLVCGAFLDFAKRLHPNPDYCYRFLSIWNTVFQAAAAFCLFLLYREWKRMGGAQAFVPPGSIPPQDAGSVPIASDKPQEIPCL